MKLWFFICIVILVLIAGIIGVNIGFNWADRVLIQYEDMLEHDIFFRKLGPTELSNLQNLWKIQGHTKDEIDNLLYEEDGDYYLRI